MMLGKIRDNSMFNFTYSYCRRDNWLLLKFTPTVCKRYKLFKCEKFTRGFPPVISIPPPPPHLRCKCSVLQECSSEKTRTSWSCVILIMCSIQRNCTFSH